MDFAISNDLDFITTKVDGNTHYLFTEDPANTIVCALLSDVRVNESRGHWARNLHQSDLWTLNQYRNAEDILAETEDSIRVALQFMIEEGSLNDLHVVVRQKGEDLLCVITGLTANGEIRREFYL